MFVSKLVLALQVFSVTAASHLAPLYGHDHQDVVLGSYIVNFEQNHTITSHWEAIGADLSNHDGFQDFKAIWAYAAKLDLATLDLVRSDPKVDFVEADRVVDLTARPVNITSEQRIADPGIHSPHSKRDWDTIITQNVPYSLAMASAGEKIDQVPVPDFLLDYFHEGSAGKGVNIYIVDSGVRISHREFDSGRATILGGRKMTDQAPFCGVQDSDYETNEDWLGHGTLVASIAAGKQTGIAPFANVISVKMLCRTRTTLARLTTMFTIITDDHNYDKQNTKGFRGSVVNLSWGGYDPQQAYRTVNNAIGWGRWYGINYIAAAGNDNIAAGDNFPCYSWSVLCVGGVDASYVKASDSNWGSVVQLTAPSVNIYGASASDDGSYVHQSGTSFAAPYISGAAAIFVSWLNLRNGGADRYLAYNSLSISTGWKAVPQLDDVKPFVMTGMNDPRKGAKEPFLYAGENPVAENDRDELLVVPILTDVNNPGSPPPAGAQDPSLRDGTGVTLTAQFTDPTGVPQGDDSMETQLYHIDAPDDGAVNAKGDVPASVLQGLGITALLRPDSQTSATQSAQPTETGSPIADSQAPSGTAAPIQSAQPTETESPPADSQAPSGTVAPVQSAQPTETGSPIADSQAPSGTAAPIQSAQPTETGSPSSYGQVLAWASYTNPLGDPSAWSRLINYDTNKLGIVVANVLNGPDYVVDPNWADVIQRATASGKTVLGYVRTGYLGLSDQRFKTRLGSSDLGDWISQIEQDVDKWYELYGSNLGGIFFDEGWPQCGPNGGYSDVYAYINGYTKRKHSSAFTVLNPGSPMDACFEDTMDTLLTFEASYDTYKNHYVANNWTPKNDRKIWHIVYNVPQASINEVVSLSQQRHAGYLEVTDAVPPNPYAQVPVDSYMQTVMSAVSGGSISSAPAQALSGSYLSGLPSDSQVIAMDYTSVTLTWSEVSNAIGYAVYKNGDLVLELPYFVTRATVGMLPSAYYGWQFEVRTIMSSGTQGSARIVYADTQPLPSGGAISNVRVIQNSDGSAVYNADVLVPYAFVRLFIASQPTNGANDSHSGWPINLGFRSPVIYGLANYMVEGNDFYAGFYKYGGAYVEGGTALADWNWSPQGAAQLTQSGYTYTWNVPTQNTQAVTSQFVVQGQGYAPIQNVSSGLQRMTPCAQSTFCYQVYS